jgi:hypothetical protein
MPLGRGAKDIPWPSNKAEKWIVHFPQDKSIWSFGQRLRRQRAAGQEVLRAPDRVGDGARAGMARWSTC